MTMIQKPMTDNLLPSPDPVREELEQMWLEQINYYRSITPSKAYDTVACPEDEKKFTELRQDMWDSFVRSLQTLIRTIDWKGTKTLERTMVDNKKYYIKITIGVGKREPAQQEFLYVGENGLTDNILDAQVYDSVADAESDVDCAFWQGESGDKLNWNDELDDYDYGYDIVQYPPELLKVRDLLTVDFWQNQTYGEREFYRIESTKPETKNITYGDLEEMLGMGGWENGVYSDFAECLVAIIKNKLGFKSE